MTDHIDEMVDAYVLGALESVDYEAIDAHLATCSRCRALVAASRATADALLLAMPLHTPPPRLKSRIMARVQHEAARLNLPDTTPVTATQPTGLQRFIQRLAGTANDPVGSRLKQYLASPDCTIVSIKGTDAARSASARLITTPGSNDAVLVTAGLNPLPRDRAYQLWLLRDGTPEPSVVFQVGRDGLGQHIVPIRQALGVYDAVAVTPEPAGGSPAPTGTIMLLGQVA